MLFCPLHKLTRLCDINNLEWLRTLLQLELATLEIAWEADRIPAGTGLSTGNVAKLVDAQFVPVPIGSSGRGRP